MYGGSSYNPNPTSYTGTGGPVSPSHVLSDWSLWNSLLHPGLLFPLLLVWSVVLLHILREIFSILALLYQQYVQSKTVTLDFSLWNHLQFKARIFGTQVVYDSWRYWSDPSDLLRPERQSAVCVWSLALLWSRTEGYVRIIGVLRQFQDKIEISGYHCDPITNFNEITIHYLSCIQSYLYFKKRSNPTLSTSTVMNTSDSDDLETKVGLSSLISCRFWNIFEWINNRTIRPHPN